MNSPELEAWKRRAETAESECRRLNPLVVRLRRERDAAVDEASRLTIPGSAEQASKAEPKDGSAKVGACTCGAAGDGDKSHIWTCPAMGSAQTPKAEPKPTPPQSEVRERPTREGMIAFVEEASKIVASWPRWKQEVLRAFPPDHIGDTNKMEPATFAPLPEGWRPDDALMPSNLREEDMEAIWLRELNRLRRELHELRSAKGDKHE